MSELLLERHLTRKVWSKLRDGPVPIVAQEDINNISVFLDEYNAKLRNRDYVPGVGHGYLGLQKGSGVTRFLPVLSKEDMAVYYHLCGKIGDQVLVNKTGIFGGWRSIPTSKNLSDLATNRRFEDEAAVFQNNYYINSFSNRLWLAEFKSFTQLIKELATVSSEQNYVALTDVANFYDSIEIPRLIKRLRKDIPRESKNIELLEVFLGFWNRRTFGYSQSSKGIPQEIISDGSRFLSHYYLQEFDDRFERYCKQNFLQYVRWADDLLIFGPNPKSLEHAVHMASRLLLSEGLNLNAPKTRIVSTEEFAKYRGVEVLSAIDSGNPMTFRSKLRSAMNWHSKGKPLRLDTIFRATLGYTYNLGANAKHFEKDFLFKTADSFPDIIETLNDIQLLRLISLAGNSREMFLKIRKVCLRRPFTGARANFLMLIRRRCVPLVRIGISKKLLVASIVT